jgi:hypothetical protein
MNINSDTSPGLERCKYRSSNVSGRLSFPVPVKRTTIYSRDRKARADPMVMLTLECSETEHISKELF